MPPPSAASFLPGPSSRATLPERPSAFLVSSLYSARRACFSSSESMWNELRMRMSSGAITKLRCLPRSSPTLPCADAWSLRNKLNMTR